MNLILEPRHWIMMFGAGLLAAVAFLGLPAYLPLLPLTAYAFPLIGLAVIVDTLGTAAERYRGLLKLAGWLCLVAGAYGPSRTSWAVYRPPI
jgi:type IV secretion system protein VirD4